ncbi:protein-(glutamine-N5) methyltransferase, release factor-specific, partial [Yersinia enterocolitica]
MDYQQWLSQAAARFNQSDSPKRDAEILLSFVTGRART